MVVVVVVVVVVGVAVDLVKVVVSFVALVVISDFSTVVLFSILVNLAPKDTKNRKI